MFPDRNVRRSFRSLFLALTIVPFLQAPSSFAQNSSTTVALFTLLLRALFFHAPFFLQNFPFVFLQTCTPVLLPLALLPSLWLCLLRTFRALRLLSTSTLLTRTTPLLDTMVRFLGLKSVVVRLLTDLLRGDCHEPGVQ
jgi:hypothetical protein